jgi:hypothetical protein
VPSRHAALAVVVGLLCGAAAARFAGPAAPYAAIAGAVLLYPALIAAWRRRPRFG